MEFREGMLGVVIVALALTGAFFVSYLSGIETTEQEVTKYDYLADVSGLFDYDKSPQYIEFDPSTNYTGYYSTASGEYFPEDEVGYEPLKNGTNNYRLNIEPELIDSNDVDLSSMQSLVDPFDELSHTFTLTYSSSNNHTFNGGSISHIKTVTLKSVIAEMTLGDDVNCLEFRSLGQYEDYTASSEYDADWVLFTSSSMWILNNSVHTLNLASDEWFEEKGVTPPYSTTLYGTMDVKYYLPINSCIVDLNTGLVSLYYDNDCTDLFTTTGLNDTYVSFGGSTSTYYNTIIFDDTVSVTQKHIERTYLDPAYGVTMKDAEA